MIASDLLAVSVRRDNTSGQSEEHTVMGLTSRLGLREIKARCNGQTEESLESMTNSSKHSSAVLESLVKSIVTNS